ncbi:MAG TPA: histidinol dehydrogenase [Longimicrobiales bacterium]|nr:histidinol dehydrogenase [Longimicrobiales bacterium]
MSGASIDLRVGLRGRIGALEARDVERLMRRERLDSAAAEDGADGDIDLRARVAELIGDVRARGDAALLDAAARFDGVRPAALEVPREAWREALDALAPAERAALADAARAIVRVHEAQRPVPIVVEPRPGVVVGRRPEPLARVGVYAPGGRAAYPSSVLMGALPARIAGVAEVVVCSPATTDGLPRRAVLAACAVAGVDRVFAAGGASAIAALAFGTRSVPAVDRIVGPGNAWVDEAKRQVSGIVGIDNPAGPSELLVVCDDGADPAGIAAELLAQAEHDPDAAVVLVALGATAAAAVEAELAAQLARAPRVDVAATALARRGAVLIAATLDDALDFAAEWAPEHLLLRVRRAEDALPRVRNAGTVFLGATTSVAHGDYMTGANHVLPTGGAARFWSGLSVNDFVRWTTWQTADAGAARDMAAPIAALAALEGLPSHGAAALRAAGVDRDAGAPAPGFARTIRPRVPFIDFPLYSPARAPVALDLSANTSRWGVAPAVRRVLEVADTTMLRDYPTPYADALRDALAERFGLEPANVATGCGSDDVIDSALRAFCEPGSTLAHPMPTFPMADVFARMNALRTATVPLDDDGGFDVARLAAARPGAVYLCSPNNPTGAAVPRACVVAVLERTDALVLLDEAYADFAGESLLDLALESGRALVVRTFSKAHGLAGARVGYALGPARLIAAVEASRGPYKVGALAERLALAALSDHDWTARAIRDAVASREALSDALCARGLRVWPSRANFVLFAPPVDDATRLASGLRARGVGVRAFSGLGGPAGAIRVTVAPEPDLRRFLDALDAVLSAEVVA